MHRFVRTPQFQAMVSTGSLRHYIEGAGGGGQLHPQHKPDREKSKFLKDGDEHTSMRDVIAAAEDREREDGVDPDVGALPNIEGYEVGAVQARPRLESTTRFHSL